MNPPSAAAPDPDLAALVGSRLCHDLVSPLGAIGNGLELLQMTLARSPELDLMAQAAAAAQSRLRLFRLAFGAASEGQVVRPSDLAEALSALETNGRIRVQTEVAGALPRLRARRLALAALCAETALAWGGELRITDGSIRAEAPRLRQDAALWAALAEGRAPDSLTAAVVHFALLAQEGAPSVKLTPNVLTLIV